MSCYKCEWLGVMGPCPHADEPFPIAGRAQRYGYASRSRTRTLDVVKHIALGVMDDADEEADLDAEDLTVEGSSPTE